MSDSQIHWSLRERLQYFEKDETIFTEYNKIAIIIIIRIAIFIIIITIQQFFSYYY